MILLSTAYLPPIAYFQNILQGNKFHIEKHEHFVKQTYRNRCNIFGANGVQSLSIPLVNTHTKTIISDIRIAYKENWQHRHWRAIESAYRNSPYFIYYEEALKKFYEERFEFLFDYNTEILKVLLKILKWEGEICFTNSYADTAMNDLRNSLSPKNRTSSENFKPYTQVFGNKHGFQSNLSIVDLIFNVGPEARDHLKH